MFGIKIWGEKDINTAEPLMLALYIKKKKTPRKSEHLVFVVCAVFDINYNTIMHFQ